MTHNDYRWFPLFGWNHVCCVRGYSKHFSCGNSLLVAMEVIVSVVKTEKKDTVLANKATQALEK